MTEEELSVLIYEWQSFLLSQDEGIERNAEKIILESIGSKPMKIITGFRRSGKSFIVQRIARKLVNSKKYSRENLLYLNFEDFRLAEVLSPKDLSRIYDFFLSRIAKKGKKLLILDEIQNVNGWDKWIRTIYEKEKDIEIILTGSNSQLLSQELGTNLAGRFIEFFIFPFSFKEFLTYRQINVNHEKDYLQNRQEIRTQFYEFLKFGGLPEVLDIRNEESKLSYLQGIVTKVILDDVIKRFNIENINLLEKLLSYLLSTAGNIVAYTKLKNRIQAYGLYDIKVETIIKYINYLTKPFALVELNKFDWKQSKVFSTSKKFYAIDTGLLSLYRPFNENYPYRLENVLFLELKRKTREMYYGLIENHAEIDFLTHSNLENWHLYQVSAELKEENLKRELNAFYLADKHLKRGKFTVFTLEEESNDLSFKGISIYQRNIIRYLLFGEME
ncbi:MAG TPA: ATP-binding protein [Leptospiraceae bacterium]|nr:ATP-binding protein [Leptospiraceae bacterium]HRG74443.1 ATP-binding protein [Leptospiraceae bacterium]